MRQRFGLSTECQVGQRVQRLLAIYAHRGERPDGDGVLEDARSLLRVWPFVGFNPGPQRVATLTVIGLQHLPPLSWSFLGSEVATGDGRVDFTWRAAATEGIAAGSIVFDELKVGSLAGRLRTPDTLDQVERYLRFGSHTYGAMFAGVRLVSLSRPRRSMLYRPGPGWRDSGQPLAETAFWFAPPLGGC